ncbi:MAG: putative Lactoylglutathione lyase [Candidatus Taylorbacteria bacterium]|nr:putative Lactoylglutathione lyase [Candidatus Taylorbacteria bacterium]
MPIKTEGTSNIDSDAAFESTRPRAPRSLEINEIAFVSYSVTDVPKAKHFYEDILGLKPTSIFGDGVDFAFIEYEIGTHTLAIGKGATDFVPGKAGAVAAFEVEDFDEAVKVLKENSILFVNEPADYPTCNMVTIEDPDGNRVMIHRRKNK